MRYGVIVFIILTVFSCKSGENRIDPFVKTQQLNNKYEDLYKNNIYRNNHFKFTITFDEEWVMSVRYEDFEGFEKRQARYFNNDTNELMLIGFNDQKKIGVRCSVEGLGLSNSAYADAIKSTGSAEMSSYRITMISSDPLTLPSLEGILMEYKTSLNARNEFTFYTFLFKNAINNFRIDFWIKSSDYEAQKAYLKKIIESIDFE